MYLGWVTPWIIIISSLFLITVIYNFLGDLMNPSFDDTNYSIDFTTGYYMFGLKYHEGTKQTNVVDDFYFSEHFPFHIIVLYRIGTAYSFEN